ncbi:MAG: ribonuclease H-like domain-containing protein, partial [Dehalococcoidia bacterium]
MDAPAEASVTGLRDLSVLGGRWFSTRAGPGYVIESRYEGAHSHGSVALHRALGADTGRLARQAGDARLDGIPIRDYLFIDTETTGLGGAGTLVFLAGVARFEGSTLLLRQFILPSPADEPGLLDGLGEELDAAKVLVSFNGKSFDLPALEARAIMARKRPAWRILPHLDLLHPNRRLFRGTLSAHRLIHLEKELLKFEREDDCPSAEVPMRYFRFQATGDPTWIRPVLRHNAWDILSLVALTALLSGVHDGEAGPLQAARAAVYERDWEHAAANFVEVLSNDPPRAVELEAREGAARALSRIARHEDAAEQWRCLLAAQGRRLLFPYVELAKVLEHRLRKPTEALAVVDAALSQIEKGL